MFTLVSIFDINYGNMGFHGNQIGDMVPILLAKKVLLTFQWNKMKRFWMILKMTTGFYTKNWFEMEFSLFFIKLLISPLILAREY